MMPLRMFADITIVSTVQTVTVNMGVLMIPRCSLGRSNVKGTLCVLCALQVAAEFH